MRPLSPCLVLLGEIDFLFLLLPFSNLHTVLSPSAFPPFLLHSPKPSVLLYHFSLVSLCTSTCSSPLSLSSFLLSLPAFFTLLRLCNCHPSEDSARPQNSIWGFSSRIMWHTLTNNDQRWEKTGLFYCGGCFFANFDFFFK